MRTAQNHSQETTWPSSLDRASLCWGTRAPFETAAGPRWFVARAGRPLGRERYAQLSRRVKIFAPLPIVPPRVFHNATLVVHFSELRLQRDGCLENFSRRGRGHRFEMHTRAQVLDP